MNPRVGVGSQFTCRLLLAESPGRKFRSYKDHGLLRGGSFKQDCAAVFDGFW